MNKKEVAELRKQLTLKNCNIQKMALCYVDGKKNQRMQTLGPLIVHPEAEIEKYLSLFKQTLTGSIGKKLLNLDFHKTKDCSNTFALELLEKIRRSELTDEESVQKFYQTVIENYYTDQGFLIAMIYGCYDVPIRHEDNSYEKDSNNVYRYLQCAICPVESDSQKLTYFGERNEITMGQRNFIVNKPSMGFLYPAFHDRTGDCYHILFYTKDEKFLPEDMISNVLECDIPMPAHKQRECFNDILSVSLADHNIEKVNEIQKAILEYEKDTIDKDTLCRILKENGIGEDEINAFRNNFYELEKNIGNAAFTKSNISDKKTSIEMGQVQIVAPAEENFFSIQTINGRKCIVIPVSGNLILNGISCN